VSVVHGFDRCRTPPLNVDVGEQTALAPTNVHGTSAAAAVPASASAATPAAARIMGFFIRFPPVSLSVVLAAPGKEHAARR
jgi:hypothetical protein